METTSLVDDPRFPRLPKWAQQKIQVMTQDLRDAREKLAAGPEDSDTIADPYTEPRPLGRRVIVEFRSTGKLGGTFRVRLDQDGNLNVNGDGPVAVKPKASNSVLIELVAR